MAERELEAARRSQPSAGTNQAPNPAPAAAASPGHPPLNVVKWSLGFAGLGMLFITGAAMFILIVAPVFFRSLKPAQQQELIDKVPFLEAFKPTAVYAPNSVLPTVSADTSGSALALLSSPVPPVASPTPNSTPTELIAAIQSTSILATNTPVISTALPSPTRKVTPTAQVTAVPTATPEEVNVPVPVSYLADGFNRVQQGWNGCGPANMTQVLNYYGWNGKKETAEGYLKPNREDRNVSPWEMVNFVNETHPVQNLKALYRYGGDLKLIKTLVSQKFGVIVEKGSEVVNEGWMGHYLTIVGYDDTQRQMRGLDTWLQDTVDGKYRPIDYDEFTNYWQQFNYIFIVVYPASREAELANLLGSYADFNASVAAASNKARLEASAHPENGFTWFNLVTTSVLQKNYKDAAIAFTEASKHNLPWRMLWYQFAPYEAFYNMGNYKEVLNLADSTLLGTAYIEETFYWQGIALAALGDKAKSMTALRSALDINPNFQDAKDALSRVQNDTFQVPAVAQK